MPINYWLASAAVLVMGLGVFHSLLGERYLVRRLLRRDDLPQLFGGDSFTKLTIRYAWHLLTILAILVGALLAILASTPPSPTLQFMGRVIGGALVACAAWGIIATQGRHLSWIVMAAAAACTLIGLRAA